MLRWCGRFVNPTPVLRRILNQSSPLLEWSKQHRAVESLSKCVMDWTGCELVERIPGKVSGQPIVRGTRILADTILGYSDRAASIDEIREDYPGLTADIIRSLIAFAHSRRDQLPQA
jgi:uncharacterized protein (DUF433 family)